MKRIAQSIVGVGLVLITIGISLVYLPAGFVCAGVGCVGYGMFVIDVKPKPSPSAE